MVDQGYAPQNEFPPGENNRAVVAVLGDGGARVAFMMASHWWTASRE